MNRTTTLTKNAAQTALTSLSLPSGSYPARTYNATHEIVSLITWNNPRFGTGYRTRRTSEYLIVLQKAPKRAKGTWTHHDIPDA